jgi:hypothetical protein
MNKSFGFLNFSGLEDKEAQKIIGNFRSLVSNTEKQREKHVKRVEENVRIYRNQLWTEQDFKFFEQFDMTPYQIPEARAPINRLVNQQRQVRYDLQLIPLDPHSFDRHRRNRDEWVEKNIHQFSSPEEAEKYFDSNADDELASSVGVYYSHVQQRNNAKYLESEVFEAGTIMGCDFLKTTYSYKDTPDGMIKRERRSVRQMGWDYNSMHPLLADSEYFFEVNRLYKSDLISMFPEHREQIEERFEHYTNLQGKPAWDKLTSTWKDFYSFDVKRSEHQLKVVEMWHKEISDFYQLENKENGDLRLIRHDLQDEDEIWDILYEIETDALIDQVRRGEIDPDVMDMEQEQLKQFIQEETRNKYNLLVTQAPIWVKCVFTHDGMFEHKVNPLPHNSHPYTPFFAQIIEGEWSGVIDDVKDLLIALNKAVMFREIMMAHGAKGATVVDKKTLSRSGYSVEDFAEMWTQIGAVIDLDISGGRRLSDVFQHVTTIGQGLAEIGSVINELEQKMYKVIGINEAMLGTVGNEAPAAAIRQRIQQGSGINGIIFDNFSRALQTHVHEKVIPLVVTEMLEKKPKMLRTLSEKRAKWIELTYDKDFELFADALNSGNFVTKLITQETDRQISQQQSALLLQTAMSNPAEFSTQAALEFAEIPKVQEFLRRNRELVDQRDRKMAAQQVDLQMILQTMLEQGIDQETANKIQSTLQLQRMKELQSLQNQQAQTSQGMGQVQSQANEGNRLQSIENNALQ